MEISKERNSGLLPGRGSKVFESVWIPKHRTIRLELGLVGHPSKIQSYFSSVSEKRLQFKVESTDEHMDGTFGTISCSQNSTRDLSYLYRAKKDRLFASDLIQGLKRLSNQVNHSTTLVNQTFNNGNQSSNHYNQSSTHGIKSSTRGNQSSTRGNQSSTRGNQSSTRGNQSSTRGNQSSVHGNQSSTHGNQCFGSFHAQSNLSHDPMSLQKCELNSTNRDGCFWNNSCRSNVLDQKTICHPESFNLSGFLRKCNDRCKDFGSRQDDESGSYNRKESPGQYWNHSNVPCSSLVRDVKPSVGSGTLEVCSNRSNVPKSTHPLPPNQEDSCIKNTIRSLGSCSVPCRELEHSHHATLVGEDALEGLVPASDRIQSNEYQNLQCFNQDLLVEENALDGLIPFLDRTQSNDYASILEVLQETYSSEGSGTKKSIEKGTKKEPHEAFGGSSKRTPFRCPKCKVILPSAPHLKRHVGVHRWDFMWKCPICPKRYRRRDCLKVHIKGHEKKFVPHSCERCGLQFSKRIHLDRHKLNCSGRV